MNLPLRKAAMIAAMTVIALWMFPSPAHAHPLGNFTINVSASMVVSPDEVVIRYVVDMAEIPAFQERRLLDRNHDGFMDAAETRMYAADSCGTLAGGLDLRAEGKRLHVGVVSGAAAFPPGAGGLVTLRLECRLSAGGAPPVGTLIVRDGNYPGRIGWREITATGSVRHSTVPAQSASDELKAYPRDLLQSPPDVRSATIELGQGGAGEPLPPRRDRATASSQGLVGSFTNLVAREHVTPGFVALAILAAVALGAAHAFAPGHGKTVMAAYLVGVGGSARQASIIAATVTVTHTIGVLILGAVVAATSSVASDRVYPWLGLAGGVLLAAVGAGMLKRAMTARTHHHHARESSAGTMRMRGLVAMGIAGGMVPSPSALIVLLGAIALGRPALGVALVIAYGAGMAVTLTSAGLALARVRDRLDARSRAGGRIARVVHALPVATALAVLALGFLLAVRGAARV